MGQESGADTALGDRRLVCLECGEDFIFTEGEQQFFGARHLTEPRRCRACRLARRLEDRGRRSMAPARPHDVTARALGLPEGQEHRGARVWHGRRPRGNR